MHVWLRNIFCSQGSGEKPYLVREKRKNGIPYQGSISGSLFSERYCRRFFAKLHIPGSAPICRIVAKNEYPYYAPSKSFTDMGKGKGRRGIAEANQGCDGIKIRYVQDMHRRRKNAETRHNVSENAET